MSSSVASSTICPAYITSTRSATSATTPRSWVISTTARPRSALSSLDQPQDLRLDRHVERGGRLVGDQQRRAPAPAPSRSSPAAACRRRTRAGSRARAVRDSGCRPSAAARRRARGPRRLGHVAVRADHLDDLIADAVDGVQRRHRILEDHRDVLAADVAQLVVARARSRSRPSNRTEPAIVGVGCAGQPEQGLRGDALAGAGFADDRQDLALGQVERDARRPRARTPSSVAKLTCRSLDGERDHAGCRLSEPDARIEERVQRRRRWC